MEKNEKYYRTVIIKQLREFLTGKITKDQVYKWALAQVVLPGYENVAQADPVVKEALQALVAITHDDARDKPTGGDLKYYLGCLEGNRDFEPLEERRRRKDVKKEVKKRDYKAEARLTSRVYVILFGLSCLVVNIFSIINPGFFTLGINAPDRFSVLIQSLPHIIYATLILLPPQVLVKKNSYFVYLIIFALFSVYYWFVALSFVLKFSLNPLLMLVLAPYSGMPAILALLLLIEERKNN